MPRALVFSALVLGLGMVGCQKPSPIVGTWNTTASVKGITFKSVATFEADGTYQEVSTSQIPGAQLTATDMGTWKLEGDKLTCTLTDIVWTFSGTTSERQKAAQERFEKNKKKLLENANAKPTHPIKWNGSNEFTLTDDGVQQVYVKEK